MTIKPLIAEAKQYLELLEKIIAKEMQLKEIQAEIPPTTIPLSSREKEIYDRIKNGEDRPAIAKAMRLSPKTVDAFKGRIKKKLGYKSNREMARAARKEI